MNASEPIDKAAWGPGPWQTEPDRVEFRHAGLPCLLVRNRMGNWCGYAAVAPGHALYGRHCRDPDVHVHGGLTYADRCSGEICYVPEEGEPEDVWWFGFDCAHAYDLVPELEAYMRKNAAFRGLRDGHDTYRDVAYVRREAERLAEQLAKIVSR